MDQTAFNFDSIPPSAEVAVLVCGMYDRCEQAERELAAERGKVRRMVYLAGHFAHQIEPPDPHAEGENCRDCDYRREIARAGEEYNIKDYDKK